MLLEREPGVGVGPFLIWKNSLDGGPENGPDPAFKPHRFYRPGRRGLIPWAFGELKCSYFWVASAEEDPANRPWQEVSMSTSEFVHRILADREFEPFSIARLMPEPDFYPMDRAGWGAIPPPCARNVRPFVREALVPL